MRIFDRLFGKSSANEKPNHPENILSSIDIQLSDIISDWFKETGLNVGDFQTKFLNPCIEFYKADPRMAYYFQNQVEQNLISIQTSLALLYLSAKKPHVKFIESVLSKLFDNKPRTYQIREFLQNPKIAEGFKEAINLKNTCLLGSSNLKNFHAAVMELDSNFSMPSSIISQLNNAKFQEDPSIFIAQFDFVASLDFEVKPFVFLHVLVSQRLVSRENRVESITIHDDLILEKLNKAVKKFNEDFDLTISMQEFLDFGKSIYTYAYSQKWLDSDYKNRKNIKVDDIPALVHYVNSVKDGNNVLTLLVAGLPVMYIGQNESKLFGTFLKMLYPKVKVNSAWLQNLMSYKEGPNTAFVLDNIFIPLFEKVLPDLNYDDPLRQNFETKIFYRSIGTVAAPSKKGIDLLIKVCESIADPVVRNFYLMRYTNAFGTARVNDIELYDFWVNLNLDDKTFTTLKKLVSDLNLILPATLLNVSKASMSYREGECLFKLHANGKDMEFSRNYMEELNKLLTEEKTGMRLIPIPIRTFNTRDGIKCAFAIAFLNQTQFRYLTRVYFAEHFPSIKRFNVSQFLVDDTFEGMDVPALYERAQSTATDQKIESESGIANNSEWLWFKERYIDTLSSPQDWYILMENIIVFPESKKLLKDWTSKIHAQIHTMGEERFTKELGVLINASIKEEFWFFDKYAVGLKGIIKACTIIGTDSAMAIVKTIIEAAYTKVSGVGPRSAALGNFGLNALAASGQQTAFGMLNIMRTKSKYQRFVKAIDKYLTIFKEHSDQPEEELTDKSIPLFGFKNGEKIIQVSDDLMVKISFDKMKLLKVWQSNGKESKNPPADFKSNHPNQEKEIQQELKQINAVLKDLKHRVKSYWMNNRIWNAANWSSYIFNHDLIYPWIENMIWQNLTQNKSFIVSDRNLIEFDRSSHTLNTADEIRLWHPVLSSSEEIENWQNYILHEKIQQSDRQAFRENYPFSENESKMIESPRFSGHFLEVNKLMAIANASGWIFTYVHEDVSWPRIYLKSMNLTAHLKCIYNRSDFAIPTQQLFFTEGDTTKISFNSKFEQLELNEIPAVTRSEICRDIDLFIAITSVANNPSLVEKSEKLGGYRIDFTQGLFSENGTAKIRKAIIQKLIPVLGIKSSGFENNYIIINGKTKDYRINLGSGFAQIKQTQEHINLIPDMSTIKRNKKVKLPFDDDETLNIILAKALLLQELE